MILATEIFCGWCQTVAYGSERALGPGDQLKAEDLVRADERQPEPEDGMAVACAECGRRDGFRARGERLDGIFPLFGGPSGFEGPS